jgi:hypothetical protein
MAISWHGNGQHHEFLVTSVSKSKLRHKCVTSILPWYSWKFHLFCCTVKYGYHIYWHTMETPSLQHTATVLSQQSNRYRKLHFISCTLCFNPSTKLPINITVAIYRFIKTSFDILYLLCSSNSFHQLANKWNTIFQNITLCTAHACMTM